MKSLIKEAVKSAVGPDSARCISMARRHAVRVRKDGWAFVFNRWFGVRSALEFPPWEVDRPGQAPAIHLLTCRRDLLMALWALRSWYVSTGRRDPLCLHDDGTLADGDMALVARLYPGAHIIPRDEADRRVSMALATYPRLLAWRKGFPLAAKVLDFALFSSGRQMLLFDSDLFFFRKPDSFLAYLDQGRVFDGHVFCRDYQDAYALTRGQVRDTLGTELPVGLNSGFGLARVDAMDWSLLERMLEIPDTLGVPVWMEQTMWAVLSARRELVMLDANEYQVVRHPGVGDAVMRHYVGDVRLLFYTECVPFLRWRMDSLPHSGQVVSR